MNDLLTPRAFPQSFVTPRQIGEPERSNFDVQASIRAQIDALLELVDALA